MQNVICHILFLAVCITATGCSQIGAMRRGDSQSHVEASEVDRVLSIARLTERRGEASQARDMYEGLVAGGNALATANHRLGVMAAKNRDFERAWKHFDAAQANGLDSTVLFADIGYARLLSGEFDVAEELFAKALKRTPSDKRSLNNMAILRGAQGRFSESLAYSRKAVGPAEAQANLGYMLSQFGDADKAVKHYHLALNQDPSLKVAASALLQIERANLSEPVMPPEVMASKAPKAKSAVAKPMLERAAVVSEAVRESEPVIEDVKPSVVESLVVAAVAEAMPAQVSTEVSSLVEFPVSEEIDEKPVAKSVAYEVQIPSDGKVREGEWLLEEEEVDVVEAITDEEVEAFFDRVAKAKVDAAKKAESIAAGSDVEELENVAEVNDRASSPADPRMSSRRRWSRSEFAGEARTISYFANASGTTKCGFSSTRLPNVADAK